MMAIVSPMLVQRTERGDEMFMTMIERHCEQVLDTDALALLPEPVAPQPLTPDPADEFAHPAGAEPMWNESWYCDFVDPRQRIGGYVRLGLMPNEGVAWFTALLCGPDQPTVAVIDFTAPLTDPYTLHTEDIRLHPCDRVATAEVPSGSAWPRRSARRSRRTAARRAGPRLWTSAWIWSGRPSARPTSTA